MCRLNDLPVVLYGAGNRAALGKRWVESRGFCILCFVDADKSKQGLECLGLPIMNLEKAKNKYGDFSIYITPDVLFDEIYDYLLDSGIKEMQILNYKEPLKKCIGCADLDRKLNVSTCLFPCCTVNKTMNAQPKIYFDTYDWDMETTVTAYFNMRDNLIKSIENGDSSPCLGCSSIKTECRPIEKKIKQIVFPFPYPCQLSCKYCVQNNAKNTLRGREKIHAQFMDNFDYRKFISLLEKRNSLHYDAQLVFAGGELTINPQKDKIIDALGNYRTEIFTNAVIYDEQLAELSSKPGNSILVSVDSGMRNTYKHIKGMDVFDKVWRNIKRYTDRGVLVKIKYIILPENSNEADINGFIGNTIKAGVHQISLSVNYWRKQNTDDELRIAAEVIILAEQAGLSCLLEETFTTDEMSIIHKYSSELRDK